MKLNMGIFKKLFGTETPSSNKQEENDLETPINRTETPEQPLEKTRTERGKEIAEKRKEEIKQYWEKTSFPKFKKVGNWFKNRRDTALFAPLAIGESEFHLASNAINATNKALEKRKDRKEFIKGIKEGKTELKQEAKFNKAIKKLERKEFIEGMKEGKAELKRDEKERKTELKREALVKRKMEIFEGFKEKMAKLLNINKELTLQTKARYEQAQNNINRFRNEIAKREMKELQLEGRVEELEEIKAKQERLITHMDAVRALPEIPINTYDADEEEGPELDFRERLTGDVTYLLQELTDDDYQTDITDEEAQEALADEEEYGGIEEIRKALKEEAEKPLLSYQLESTFIPSNEESARWNQDKKKAA